MKGNIFNIQHFSINDGDGIRTTIFLQACPLRCLWCSNKESWTQDNKYVKIMSVEEVAKEVARYQIFYRYSGGGITYSGGEPFFQEDFLRGLVENFYSKGVHQGVETSGYFNFERLEDVILKLDHIFLDIKHMDPGRHRELTGLSNDLILENISKIARLKKEVVVRIPLIKNINDSRSNIEKTAEFLARNFQRPRIEILPYHNYGKDKTLDLGLDFVDFERPDLEDLNRVKSIISRVGVELVDYK